MQWTTFIENRFQQNLKTGAVFLDLTAAYDTVWHTVFFYKLSKSMPYWWVCCFEIDVSGCTWAMTPVLGDPNLTAFARLCPCTGSVQLLLEWPDSYMWPKIHLRWRVITYVSPFKANTSANWNVVSSDMARMSHFCQQWQLKSSTSKTISSVFRLHNTSITRELSVYLDGQRLRHECHLTYLGVTVDWQPGFDLPRQQWSLLNHFRMEEGHCGACRRKWRLTDTDLCPCGETQKMSHIVESCPPTQLNGGLSWLRSADKDTVSWLASYGSWHSYEKKTGNGTNGQIIHDLVELFEDEYYCDLEMLVRGHSRSLKMVPFESFGTVSYLPW